MPKKPTVLFEDLDLSPDSTDLPKELDPKDICKLYRSGFKGTTPDPKAYHDLRGNVPTFSQAFPEARGSGRGKVSLPFRAAVAQDPEFGVYEPQTTGDCVSHSTRNAGMLDYAIDSLFGETSWEGRFATEPIYGHRGHGGQGASCSRLALYVSPRGPGGFLVRKKYEVSGRTLDLRTYNSRIGHNWGRSGVPSWVNLIADNNKSLSVMSLKSMDDCIDALACGFGISMCSGFGFSSKRNQDGIAEQRGSWAHAMAWIAVDDTDWAHQNYGGPIILVQNSWGRFNSGGKRHEQPDGSFWIRASVANRMIRGGGGWIIASVRGFNREKVMDLRPKVEGLAA